jgi:carbon-monoxide dehydrogenase small subunit
VKVDLNLNGRLQSREVPPSRSLLQALRDDFGLKGTKAYCHIGICGACTVLVDGEVVSSCIMLAVQAHGRHVTTVEGLGTPESLHPIQRAFIDHFGFQCGYCTPGMLLTTKALLAENPRPTREEVTRFLGGNICRCTGYAGIVESVMAAADSMAAERA